MKKSFTYEVKKELLTKDREEDMHFLAFCYGLFLFASDFSQSTMLIKTENELLAKTYAACALRLAGVHTKMQSTIAIVRAMHIAHRLICALRFLYLMMVIIEITMIRASMTIKSRSGCVSLPFAPEANAPKMYSWGPT